MKKPHQGKTPSVALINPKYPHNVGAAIRAASCFNTKQVWYTGDRLNQRLTEIPRLPREERMKGYKDVELIYDKRFFDRFEDVTPVAVEVQPNAENLAHFHHPKNALYIFGPEDGSIGSVYRRFCHRFVFIPTAHCLNLACAVNVILWDRRLKEIQNGLEMRYGLEDYLQESRGFISDS